VSPAASVFVAYVVLVGLLAAVAGESEPVATVAGLVYLALLAGGLIRLFVAEGGGVTRRVGPVRGM
jgi:hypothetical protein